MVKFSSTLNKLPYSMYPFINEASNNYKLDAKIRLLPLRNCDFLITRLLIVKFVGTKFRIINPDLSKIMLSIIKYSTVKLTD